MKQLLLGGVSFGLHLYFFLSFGSLFLRIRKKEEQFSWCLTPVMGMFVYYGFFEILALPMTLLRLPLHLLTIVWGIFLTVVGLAAVFLCGRMWRKGFRILCHLMVKKKGLSILLFLLIFLQMLYAAVYGLNSADAAFYVGNVSTSLYTDTLGRYNPYTGEAYRIFMVRYVTATYYLDHAAFCQALNLHPMVQMKTVMPVLNLFLANLLYYALGMQLMKNDRKKTTFFCWAVFFFGILAGNTSVSGFMYSRTFEGKAMLHGLVIPFLFLAFLELYQGEKEREAWWKIFFASLGGVCLTTSSMTLVPAAVAAGSIAAAVRKRNFWMIGKALICILPDIAVLTLYLTVQMGWLTLYAK